MKKEGIGFRDPVVGLFIEISGIYTPDVISAKTVEVNHAGPRQNRLR
jgi:hypothetical protein